MPRDMSLMMHSLTPALHHGSKCRSSQLNSTVTARRFRWLPDNRRVGSATDSAPWPCCSRANNELTHGLPRPDE